MPYFANAKIYKLINSIDGQIYVGSTCNTLNKRFATHRSCAKTQPDRCIYNHYNNIGWHNVSIVLIEYYPCTNRLELEQRERYYIDLLKPQLNNNLPARTDDDTKQYHKQYQPQYNIDNKEKINHQRRIRYHIMQNNIKYIKHMADFMQLHQPKHYDLQELTIFSMLH